MQPSSGDWTKAAAATRRRRQPQYADVRKKMSDDGKREHIFEQRMARERPTERSPKSEGWPPARLPANQLCSSGRCP